MKISPFAGAGLMGLGTIVERRKRKALEDPVKNGALFDEGKTPSGG